MRPATLSIFHLGLGLLVLVATTTSASGETRRMRVDPGRVQSVLRLHAGPGLDSPIIAKLPPGMVVLATGPRSSAFLEVLAGALKGWASADFLVAAPRGPQEYQLGREPERTAGAARSASLLGVSGGPEGRPVPSPTTPRPDARASREGGEAAPIAGNPLGESTSVLTSPFGPRPWHSGKGSRIHQGVDLRTADAGGAAKPVFALGAGVVLFAGWDPNGGGQYVEIQHDDGHRTSYLHLSSFAGAPGKPTRTGARVTAGQRIGVTGNTGWATNAPHLHFVLRARHSTAKVDALAYAPIGRTLRPNPASVGRWKRFGWNDPRS